MVKITKELLNSLDKVNILGGSFAVYTYRDGTEECASVDNGEETLLGMFKEDEKIVNKLMQKCHDLPRESDFDLANAGYGASYFGNDGLIHTKKTVSTDPVAAEASLIHQTIRNVSVNNPVLYALTLSNMISSGSKEGAVSSIDAELFLNKNDLLDILTAVNTYYLDFEETETVDKDDLNLVKNIIGQKKAEARAKNGQQLSKELNASAFVDECLGDI